MRLADGYIRNANFDKLIEHVRIEKEIGKIRNSISDHGIGMLCEFAFDQIVIEEETSSLLAKLEKNKVSLSNIYENSLILSLASKNNIKFNNEYRERIKYSIEELIASKSYPIGKKALIYYFLKDLSWLNGVTLRLNEYLKTNGKEFFDDSRNIELIIDSSFACQDLEQVLSINELLSKVSSNSKALPREKLAKAIILLSQYDDLNITKLIDDLEESINKDLSSWDNPDIWFAILESEKLISSNLDWQDLNKLLENLKASNSKWSQVIRNIQEDGVFINLTGIVQSPKFSPLQDVLSLKALKATNRDKIIQLSSSDSIEFQKFKSIEKNGIITNKRNVNMFAFFVLFIMLLNIILIFSNYENLMESFNIFWQSSTKPKSPANIVRYMINPISLILINVWWLGIVWNAFNNEGTLSLKSIFRSYPMIKYLFKFFSKS